MRIKNLTLNLMKNRRARYQGFTLLEVLVALVIAVIGIAAVVKSTGTAATVLQVSKERLFASWVASNHLAELRVNRAWPVPGTKQSQITFGGQSWYLSQVVQPSDHPNLRRIEVQLYTDLGQEQPVYRMVSYLSEYLPPEEPSEQNP